MKYISMFFAIVPAMVIAATYDAPVEITEEVEVTGADTYNAEVTGTGGFHVLKGGSLTLNNLVNTFSGNVVVEAGGKFLTKNSLSNKGTIAGLGSVYLNCDASVGPCCWTFSSQVPSSTALYISGISSEQYPATDQGGGTILNGPVYLADNTHWYVGSNGYVTRNDGAENAAKIAYNGNITGVNADIELAAHTVVNFAGLVKVRKITAGYRELSTNAILKNGYYGGFQLAKSGNEVQEIVLDHQKLWCTANNAVNGASLTFTGNEHTTVTNFYTNSGVIVPIETSYVDLNHGKTASYTQTFKWIESDEWTQEKGYEIRHGAALQYRSTLKLSGEANKTATCYVAVNGYIDMIVNAPTSFKQVFAGRESMMSGKLTVTSGTLKLDGNATFKNVSDIEVGANGVLEFAEGMSWPFADKLESLTLTDGANIQIPEGVTLEVRRVVVNGSAIPYGVYKTLPGVIGGGEVKVFEGTAVDAVSARWVGNGADDSILMASNWDRDVTGMFTSDNVVANFSAGGDSATVSNYAILHGVEIELADGNNFTIKKGGDAALVDLGLSGIVDKAEGEQLATHQELVTRWLNVESPLRLFTDQSWNLKTNTGLRVSGGLSGDYAITVKGGCVEFNDMPEFNGSIDAMLCEVRFLGQIGREKSDGTITIQTSKNSADPQFGYITFSNAVINLPISISHGGGGIANYNQMFRHWGVVTNVFNGKVTAWSSTSFRDASDSMNIYNGGIEGGNNLYFINDDSSTKGYSWFVFNGPVVTVNSDTKSIIAPMSYNVGLEFNSTGNKAKVRLHCKARAIFRFGVSDAFETTPLVCEVGTIDLGQTHQNFTHFFGNRESVITGGVNSAICVTVGGANATQIAEEDTFDSGRILGNVSLEGNMAEGNVFRLTNVQSQSYGDIKVSSGTFEFGATSTWLNGTNVVVNGTGILKINNRVFGRQAILKFADEGKMIIPTAVKQRVRECWVGDTKIADGIYTYATAPELLKPYLVESAGVLEVRSSKGLQIIIH